MNSSSIGLQGLVACVYVRVCVYVYIYQSCASVGNRWRAEFLPSIDGRG